MNRINTFLLAVNVLAIVLTISTGSHSPKGEFGGQGIGAGDKAAGDLQTPTQKEIKEEIEKKGLIGYVANNSAILQKEIADFQSRLKALESKTKYYVWSAGSESISMNNEAQGTRSFQVPGMIPEDAQVFLRVNSVHPGLILVGGREGKGNKITFHFRDWSNVGYKLNFVVDWVIISKK